MSCTETLWRRTDDYCFGCEELVILRASRSLETGAILHVQAECPHSPNWPVPIELGEHWHRQDEACRYSDGDLCRLTHGESARTEIWSGRVAWDVAPCPQEVLS